MITGIVFTTLCFTIFFHFIIISHLPEGVFSLRGVRQIISYKLFTLSKMNYIACAEDESEESTELPLEPDGTLAMSTLQAQYPGASGLKFRYMRSEL